MNSFHQEERKEKENVGQISMENEKNGRMRKEMRLGEEGRKDTSGSDIYKER